MISDRKGKESKNYAAAVHIPSVFILWFILRLGSTNLVKLMFLETRFLPHSKHPYSLL